MECPSAAAWQGGRLKEQPIRKVMRAQLEREIVDTQCDFISQPHSVSPPAMQVGSFRDQVADLEVSSKS